MLTPNKPRKLLPKNKKRIINAPEIRVALNSRIIPILFFKDMSRGIEPIISITANSVNVTVSISFRFHFMPAKVVFGF